MFNYPNIYLLLETPVIGELGGKTTSEFKIICKEFNIKKKVYHEIEVILDAWNGEDLFSIKTLYFATERLKNKIEAIALKGFEFREVLCSKGNYFKQGKSAYSKEIPKIYMISYPFEAEGPETWWKKEAFCKECNCYQWDITDEGMDSSIGPSLTGTRKDVENPAPRTAYKSSWNGADIFQLQDPEVIPFITENFLTLLIDQKVKGIYARPTYWED